MLAELATHVIGVDTHKDTHTAAVVASSTGGVAGIETAHAATEGYEALVEFADLHSSATERAWAIEGTGSYGAGLSHFLATRGEWVLEVDRPTRPAQRERAKSDELDAVRAAREVLGRTKLAQPRARGEREALRCLLVTREGAVRDRTRAINQLKAMIVSAPEGLRTKVRGLNGAALIGTCRRLRRYAGPEAAHEATVVTLRRLAARIEHLDSEIAEHDSDIKALTKVVCPQLLDEVGVGPLGAAQAYVSWSHPGRCRTEAAYANLAGAAPIEASSGKVVRHRLNRGGDRALNRALHMVVITRNRCDPATKAYVERRLSEGKSHREARRCLKRYV
ncbi:MAG: IS110 family transposase, partial [Acidimicrobiia bacterium]